LVTWCAAIFGRKSRRLNLFENSRILNFFFEDKINLEEIKYEKIIRGMKINFQDQKFLVIIQ